MSSTRLPGKVLLPINKKPMLQHVVEQTTASKLIDNVIVATTNCKEDKQIVDFCKHKGISYFKGSKNDVLDRYYKCAKKFDCKTIVRITSDCPLIDPDIIDQGIKIFFKNSLDYLGNNIEYKNKKWTNSTCNFPHGMTVEVSSFESLKKAWKNAKRSSEREHVFPYIQFNSNIFKVGNFKKSCDLSHIRCTVDRKEDLRFVREVRKRLKNKEIVKVNDITNIIKNNHKLLKINEKIPFDEGYRISLKKDIQNILCETTKKSVTNKIRLLLYADGNHKIGMGHIYRMKNLYQFLPKNFETYFLTDNKKIVSNIIKPNNILNSNNSLSFTESKISKIKPDLIIVDKLKESTKKLNMLKQNSKFLISIDYSGRNKNIFDFGIPMLYHKTTLSSIKSKNPFDYIMLKKSFLKNKKIKIKKKIKSIIIIQGGSDTHCFIPKIIDSTNLIDDIFDITVIVGSEFKCWTKLLKSVKCNKHRIKILHNISNMNTVMSKHDLAITAGGMTLMELAYLGIPSLIVCSEKFEEETAKKISKIGFGVNLGYGKNISEKQIAMTTQSLVNDYKKRKEMSLIGRNIIDGKGGFKISQILQKIGDNL